MNENEQEIYKTKETEGMLKPYFIQSVLMIYIISNINTPNEAEEFNKKISLDDCNEDEKENFILMSNEILEIVRKHGSVKKAFKALCLDDE